MAGTVEAYVVPQLMGKAETTTRLLLGYRAALYFGTGLAGLAVVVVATFVRMPKMERYRE
jgi:hypothetical protein